jgi:hypothetical protein
MSRGKRKVTVIKAKKNLPGNLHQGVSRKAGDGLGKDQINLSKPCVLQHSLKVLPVFFRTGNALIGINPNIFPVRPLLNQPAVITDLCREGVQHGVFPCGHTGVSGYFFPVRFRTSFKR